MEGKLLESPSTPHVSPSAVAGSGELGATEAGQETVEDENKEN